MFVPVWFTHAWSTGEEDLLGAYLHCTATTPFETVCKQFINGSVPVSYSLISGFDTGNDSWFSSGAWLVGTPVWKNACKHRCSVSGEEQGTHRSRSTLLAGSGFLWSRGSKRMLLHSSKSWQKQECSQDLVQQKSSSRCAHSTCLGPVELPSGRWFKDYQTSSQPQKKEDDLLVLSTLREEQTYYWQHSECLFVLFWQVWTFCYRSIIAPQSQENGIWTLGFRGWSSSPQHSRAQRSAPSPSSTSIIRNLQIHKASSFTQTQL